ncbi:MAG: ABC transporter ATP-binding protein [Rhodoferax sp.]|jgi:branched-chain amino acid transport system ATP-binding protein|nr:ABC transporter ATP-binding protein [Rhodoferax sp.]
MTLLVVDNLVKSFGGIRAVDGVSLRLAAGEMLALIGPNGAGKSTVFNMLNGQLKADAGSVRIDGQLLLGRAPHAICRLGVGRTFQVAETFGSLTVLENVQMALLAADRRVFAAWRSAASHRREQAMALLEQVGMAGQATRACGVLAYGDVKRVELAIAMAQAPRLLLMDEPTAGMASAERQQLMALTRDWVRARGLAVLFTEHSMDVVFGFADRVLVLAQGRVIAQGSADEVRRDPQARSAYFGSGRAVQMQLPQGDAP